MFNDRDLGVLGVGALLAVLSLLLPIPFIGKIVLGLTVLVGFIILALLRLGPDRIPLEEWFLRRIRFWLQARRYTYQQPGYSHKTPWRLRRPIFSKISGAHPISPIKPSAEPVIGNFYPLALSLDAIGIYPLVTIFLAVIGIYFLVWLAQGGAAEIAQMIGCLFR